MHGGPVLPRPGEGKQVAGHKTEVREPGPHTSSPTRTVSQEGPWGKGYLPKVRTQFPIPSLPALDCPEQGA
jgi:hypothetical protein